MRVEETDLHYFVICVQGSVFSNPDVEHVYAIPKILADQNIHHSILTLLHVKHKNPDPDLSALNSLLKKINTIEASGSKPIKEIVSRWEILPRRAITIFVMLMQLYLTL